MRISELKLDTKDWHPGENLVEEINEHVHVTIAYDISGNRSKIDQRIEKIIEEDHVLKKIDYVNTLLYWQCRITGNDKDDLNSKVKNLLATKLKEIFIDPTNRSQSTVRAYCMVGNIRAFAFEIDA